MVKSAFIAFVLFCVAAAFSFAFPIKLQKTKAKPAPKYKIRTVVIDAGHGGKDPGCHGKSAREKIITLAVALELGKLIEEKMEGVKVIYTRKTDEFIELNERAAIANRNHADVFISIHCNSNPSKKINGSETYVLGMHKTEENLSVAKRENSVILQEGNYLEKYEGFNPNSPLQHIFFANLQNAHLARSLMLAGNIEEQFEKRVGRKSRGVRQAGFLVLWRTAMPSVLVELGYLTHSQDEKFLDTKKGKELSASALFRAFRDYKESIESSGS